MDDLDSLIMAVLKDDGRLSYSEIGRRLNQPHQPRNGVWSRWKTRAAASASACVIEPTKPFHGTDAVIEIYCRGYVNTEELTELLSVVPGVTLAVSVAGVADAFAFV